MNIPTCIMLCLVSLLIGAAVATAMSRTVDSSAPVVQRHDVNAKMAEQTDRLITILERKCLP